MRDNGIVSNEEFIFEYYKEQRASAQRFDNQRTAITNFMILVSGAILAFIIRTPSSPYEIYAAIFLIIIGLFGTIFVKKLNERAEYNYSRARECLKEIETIRKDEIFSKIIQSGYNKHSGKYNLTMKFRLHYIWMMPHVLISILGVTLLIDILKSMNP